MITPIEIHMKLQDATRAITRKLLKDQPDGFIADFNGRWLFVQHLRHPSASSTLVSRLDVNTGHLLEWRTLDPMGVNSITGLAIALDGESYVYSYRRVLSELFLAEGW